MRLKYQILSFLFFVTQITFVEANFCSKNDLENLRSISQSIDENPTFSETIYPTELNTITTGEHEYKKIVVEKPTRIEYVLYPQSEIKILKLPTDKCGIEIFLKGKVAVDGEHLPNNSCVEIHTEEVEITPRETSYLAETGALNNALAELNDESLDMGTDGTQEKFTVKKGSIQIRLKRVFKGLRVKQTKITSKKFKSTKTKSKMFVYNNKKIKLRKNASLKIKKSRKYKQQVAELEIIKPE